MLRIIQISEAVIGLGSAKFFILQSASSNNCQLLFIQFISSFLIGLNPPVHSLSSKMKSIVPAWRGRRSKGREKGFRGRQAISPEKGTAKETPRGRVFPMELEKKGGN